MLHLMLIVIVRVLFSFYDFDFVFDVADDCTFVGGTGFVVLMVS